MLLFGLLMLLSALDVLAASERAERHSRDGSWPVKRPAHARVRGHPVEADVRVFKAVSAFDPSATSVVHCGNGFDAKLSPSKHSFGPIQCFVQRARD